MDDTEQADPLDLQSLDTDSLLTALAAVERAVPDLLLDVKPVLAHLTAPNEGADEAGAVAARDAVDRYMATVDKIQFILRQAVFFLRETRAAPSVLRPPAPDALPRPLAATLRDSSEAGGETEAQLGLYALRVEVASLRDMLAAARAGRLEKPVGDGGNEAGGDDGAEGAEGQGEGKEAGEGEQMAA